MRWSFRELEEHWPHGATIDARGDLAGVGVWTLVQERNVVRLRRLSTVLKPRFAWNHRWAMAKGEAGLRREMERRTGARPSRRG